MPHNGLPLPEPVPPAPPDAQVVRAVLAGDSHAFSVLVDRYHARCLRVATHLLGDSDIAEDAVQEAFVRAYRHLGSYRERDRFAAWLLRIVVNQCRTNAAKESRFVRFGDEQTPNHTMAGGGQAGQTAVDSVEMAHLRKAELAHALAQLAPDQREVIVLRFSEEMSYEEIATLTGVGVSALKMRVKRACSKLRTLLTDYLHV